MIIEDLLEKYGDEYVERVLPELPESSYGNLESMVLYAFIRQENPEVVAEIGTEHKSRSSYIIESALEKNGSLGLHIMADIPGVVESARQNLLWKFNGNIKTLSGDIRSTYKLQDWSKVDFLFIDANHGQLFAKWYFDNLFPLITAGTPIHVHDIDLFGDWKWYESPYPTEAVEFLNRHEAGTLGLEKLAWLSEYTYSTEYTDKLAKIREKYPFVGQQTLDEPYKNGASYWRKL